MALHLAYYDRGREPVIMDIGPVLALEDVVGGKVCALASRIEPRDYADVAAALTRYGPSQLIRCAQRLDPGLTGRDFADAGLRLGQMKDTTFAGVGLSQADVTAPQDRFAGWPRDAGAIDRQLQAGNPAEPQPGPRHNPGRGGHEPGEDDPDPAGPQTLARPDHNSGPNRPTRLKPTGTTRRSSHDLTGLQRLLAVNHHARIYWC